MDVSYNGSYESLCCERARALMLKEGIGAIRFVLYVDDHTCTNGNAAALGWTNN